MHRLRKNNKKIFLILLILDILLTSCLFIKSDLANDKKTITAHLTKDQEKNCDSLLINTYLTKIIEASDEFYKEYYRILPTLNYYSIYVKEYISDSRLSQITFTSKPYLGPHDTIGVDEITFTADYLGNVELKSFDHLLSYHLPDNLKDLELKDFPEHYYKDWQYTIKSYRKQIWLDYIVKKSDE